MNQSIKTVPLPTDTKPAITVRHSKIHGNGVFATRKIAAGSCVIEYAGQRITAKQAVKRSGADPDNPFHTFFFSLENGKMIDGAVDGNDARWINHCCEPNCEAREEDGHIFIYALRDIRRGEELNYDYGLIVSDRQTPAVKRSYACLCGAATCRHTMLAPKRRAPRKK
ncbi:MAG: SET domain-containing protein-lysine N-methyltransferase [Pseudomonadota bacterium]